MTNPDARQAGKRIRVLVVDDQAIVRKGIRALLSTESDLDVVGEASDGGAALQQVRRLNPDVTLMDLVMPKVNGLEAIEQIVAQGLQTRVIVLTSFVTDDSVFPAIKAGAQGYLLKDSEPEDLIQGIRQVHRGEPSLHPEIARRVLAEMRRPLNRKDQTADPLTERELDVLRMVAQGLSNRQISEQLVVGETTVRTHVSSILGKLHLASRTQAALYALREGYATLNEAPDGGE
jgi:NarL family two-component system response regulator LiaR